MKRLLAVSSFLLLLLPAAFSQKVEIPVDEKSALEGKLQGFPVIEAVDVFTGDKINLGQLTARDVKYPGKPTVVITWADYFCPPCIRNINELIKAGVAKEYNLIAINLEGDYESNPNSKNARSLEQVGKIINTKEGWAAAQHYQVKGNIKLPTFNAEKAPHWYLLDKQFKVVYTYTTYNLKADTVLADLKNIEAGKVVAPSDRFYFSGLGLATKKEEAGYYIQRSKAGSQMVLKTYLTKDDKLWSEVSYSLLNGAYVYDGPTKGYHSNGAKKWEGLYENGHLVSRKSWYDNGELEGDYSIPTKGAGYGKEWHKGGGRKMHLLYENGKHHGVARMFDETGKISMEGTFVQGELDGVLKEFKEGVPTKESQYKAGKLISEKEVK